MYATMIIKEKGDNKNCGGHGRGLKGRLGGAGGRQER